MAMKSSNRWLGLLLLAVSSASAYHEGTYSYGSSSSTGCIEDYVSDGYCDNQNNNAECQYDGGDCCECTCVAPEQTWTDEDYLCGTYSSFACIDPSAACVDDDDVTAEMVEHCDSPTSIGDGWCDQGNNKAECGYDGGDCCSCTCKASDNSSGEYQCNSEYGGFQCIDPAAPCVDDDDITAEMVEQCGYIYSIGDGYCDGQNNKPECGYDGGDCCKCTCVNPYADEDDSYVCNDEWSPFACIDPSAPCVDDDDITVELVENCPHPENIADGWCNIGNNIEECGYDGGDCCECTCDDGGEDYHCNEFACVDPSAACVDDDDVTVEMIESKACYVLGVGNGWCDMENNKPECLYDGGDCCECTCDPVGDWNNCDSGFACIDPEAPCVDDDSITVDMIENCGYAAGIGNGWCDQENNKEECNYDGGDCCECTCESQYGYNCLEFACIDPNAACVDDDDITVDMFENCGYALGIGNGWCDRENNSAECNWDGGDCCSCDCQAPEHYDYEVDLCEEAYSGFDCKNPASTCFGEFVPPGWDDDDETHTDDLSEFVPWVQEGALPAVPGAVEVGQLTEVSVSATAHDERAGRSDGDVGCGEAGGEGCAPEHSRDGIASEYESRWSCATKIVDGGGPCQIEYTFAEPQDIVDIQVAFWKGNERVRTLKVHFGDVEVMTHESYSGELFNTLGVTGNGVTSVMLESVGLMSDEWISLIEVLIFVKHEFVPWVQEGPLPTRAGAVEVGTKTAVSVTATAHDTRAGMHGFDVGCGETGGDGCVPAYTRDGIASEHESRWSCASKLVDGEGPCKIEYTFQEPQDVVDMQVAFWKGSERVRTLKVHLNGVLAHTHESYSGSTFNEIAVTGTEVTTVTLESTGLTSGEWLSIIEVLIFVAP